jgi:hypothetical protein
MNNLKSILEKVNATSFDAGGAVSNHAIEELRGYRKAQFRIFLAVEALVVLGVVYCAYFVSQHSGQSTLVKGMLGLVGIGAGGGVEVMRRIWKEWSRTDLLLVLMSDASESQVKAIIDKLLKSL